MKTKLALLVVLMTAGGKFYAQNEYGPGNSNFLVTTSSKLNPASAARMNTRWMVSPLTLNATVFNNLLSLNIPYSPYRLLNNSVPAQYRNANGSPYRDWNWVNITRNASVFNFYSLIKIQGPAVFIKQKSFVWGISQELVFYNRINGLPAGIAKDQLKKLQRSDGAANSPVNFMTEDLLSSNAVFFHNNAYNSLGFSIARTFTLKRSQTISLGFTYKLLNSLGGYLFSLKSAAVNKDNKDVLSFESPEVKVTELYARHNKLSPHGFGAFDLGAEWIYQNNETRRRYNYKKQHPVYKFRLGASLLDLGHLCYTRTIKTETSLHTSVKLPDIDKLNSQNPKKLLEALQEELEKHTELSINTIYGKTIRTGLPSRALINFDYQFFKSVFLNFTAVKNLRSAQNYQTMYSPDMVQLTPRIEGKYLETGFPLILKGNGQRISQGFYLRAFHFYAGTHNLLSLIRLNKVSQAGIYAGIEISDFPGKFINRRYSYLRTRKNRCPEF